jgi:carbon monoxide dehydrogenase subunit G
VESLVEVSELEPERAFGLRMLEGPLPVDADLRFEPAGGGTRVRFRVHGQPGGAMRLLQPLLRPTLKRQFRQHCGELKHVLEGRDTLSSS